MTDNLLNGTEPYRVSELSLSSGLSWQAAAEQCLVETFQANSEHKPDTSPKIRVPGEVHTLQPCSSNTPCTDYSTLHEFNVHELLVASLRATYAYVESKIPMKASKRAYRGMADICLSECERSTDMKEVMATLKYMLDNLTHKHEHSITDWSNTTYYHHLAVEHTIDVFDCLYRRFVTGGGWVNETGTETRLVSMLEARFKANNRQTEVTI